MVPEGDNFKPSVLRNSGQSSQIWDQSYCGKRAGDFPWGGVGGLISGAKLLSLWAFCSPRAERFQKDDPGGWWICDISAGPLVLGTCVRISQIWLVKPCFGDQQQGCLDGNSRVLRLSMTDHWAALETTSISEWDVTVKSRNRFAAHPQIKLGVDCGHFVTFAFHTALHMATSVLVSSSSVTKYRRSGSSENRSWFPHRSGDCKSKVKVLAGSVSLKASLRGVQTATFSLCPLGPPQPFPCGFVPGVSLPAGTPVISG